MIRKEMRQRYMKGSRKNKLERRKEIEGGTGEGTQEGEADEIEEDEIRSKGKVIKMPKKRRRRPRKTRKARK